MTMHSPVYSCSRCRSTPPLPPPAPCAPQGSPAPRATAGSSCSACSPGTRRCARRRCRRAPGGYDPIDADALARCDVAFLALPHGESRALGEALEAAGTPVVDLGSDFRVGGWTYGLPEVNRDEVRAARAIANPGCYATATILGLAAAGRGRPGGRPGRRRRQVGHLGRGQDAVGEDPPARPARRRHALQRHRPPAHRRDRAGARAGRRRRAARDVHAAPAADEPRPAGHRLRAAARAARPGARSTTSTRPATPTSASCASAGRPRRSGSPAPTSATSPPSPTSAPGTAIVTSALDNLVKGAAGQAIQNANLDARPRRGAGLPELGLWP